MSGDKPAWRPAREFPPRAGFYTARKKSAVPGYADFVQRAYFSGMGWESDRVIQWLDEKTAKSTILAPRAEYQDGLDLTASAIAMDSL